MSRPPRQRNIVGDVAWKESGNCSGNSQATSELYAKFDSDQIKAARTWCSDCPVQQACLDYAVANVEEFGVWGGMSEKQRHRHARALRQKLVS
jgi:WhiB family transcriptional regulator, redox-sensing transcriptional regulator